MMNWTPLTAGVETVVVFVVGTVVAVRMHHHFWPAVDDDDDDYNLHQIVAGTHDGWLFQASLYRRKNAPSPMGPNCWLLMQAQWALHVQPPAPEMRMYVLQEFPLLSPKSIVNTCPVPQSVTEDFFAPAKKQIQVQQLIFGGTKLDNCICYSRASCT